MFVSVRTPRKGLTTTKFNRYPVFEMERSRKKFCYIATKIYGGRDENKTLGIHFEPEDNDQALIMARALLQAIEHNKGVDITIFKYRPLKDGRVRVTVTAPL
jgi:hypothetical protein